MTTASFQLSLKNIDGSLERLVRVIRHRGFALQSLQVELNPTGQTFQVSFAVQSEKDPARLYDQLVKLLDINELEIVEQISLARTA